MREGTASALWFEKAHPAMNSFEDFRVQFAERFHLNVADRTKYLRRLNKIAQDSPQDSMISNYSSVTELYDNLGQVGLTFHPDEIRKFIDLAPRTVRDRHDAGVHQHEYGREGTHHCDEL